MAERAVLIAEDEAGMRMLLREVLGSAGYIVLEAADGDAAWRLIERHRPPVVLLDHRMPGRTGLELIGAIRDDPRLGGTFVILLTGLGPDPDDGPPARGGPDLRLGKPISPAKLLAAVEQAFTLCLSPSRRPDLMEPASCATGA